MNAGYEEIFNGESVLRLGPDSRHERICERLHKRVASSIADFPAARLLEVRAVVRISPGSILRPDLALVTAATGKLWLAAEIVNAQDHRPDTVVKKAIYEENHLPRLWMVDPRYDNVEIYHGTPHGLALKRILANTDTLEETLLPKFSLTIRELLQEESQ